MKNCWNKFYPSVCSITFYKEGDRISSGTGFRVSNYIVTNSHVIQIPNIDQVVVRFVTHDGVTTHIKKVYSEPEFRKFLVDGDQESGWDFAILEIPDDEIQEIQSLTMEIEDKPIGSSICLLGFQFEQQNLSIHGGNISSKYIKAQVDYIQLDAAVNKGNSGGPLIDVESGTVIGIVTRKATGLTELFDQVIASFDDNIRYLEQYRNCMNISGFNPVDPLVWNQNQMKVLTKEIKRSANVGIGYAYKVSKVMESIDHLKYQRGQSHLSKGSE